jgi:hypothetical protein
MMTPENFCYWLQGSIELNGAKGFTKEQVEVIAEHLKLVFEKKTPDIDLRMNPDFPHWPADQTSPELKKMLEDWTKTNKPVVPQEVTITCDATPSPESSGVSSTSNLDATLLCATGLVGTPTVDIVDDEHAHAGQAKRVTVEEVNGFSNGFVDSKTCVTC